jgi:nucleotide-binding universal stress UspA family protein
MHVIRPGSWEEAQSGPEAVVSKLRQLMPGTELDCLPLFRVPVGRPVEEILKAAKEIHADLMVLGAKSRKGLAGRVPHTKGL